MDEMPGRPDFKCEICGAEQFGDIYAVMLCQPCLTAWDTVAHQFFLDWVATCKRNLKFSDGTTAIEAKPVDVSGWRPPWVECANCTTQVKARASRDPSSGIVYFEVKHEDNCKEHTWGRG